MEWKDMYGARMFRLVPGAIYCGREGLFVGSTPLLDRDNKGAWRVRPIEHLNRELSNRYGLPVDVATKSASLGYIALALDRDE